MIKDADNLQSSLDSLHDLLPHIKEMDTGLMQPHNLRIKCYPAVFVAATVFSRIFGTLMGWFMH